MPDDICIKIDVLEKEKADIVCISLASPSNPKVGEPASAVAKFQNKGDIAGTELCEIKVDGIVIASQSVTLDPGAMHFFGGSFTPTTSGTHEVCGYSGSIKDLCETFEVAPAEGVINIVGYKIDILPVTPKVGDTIQVTAHYRNDGDKYGTEHVKINVNGVDTVSGFATLNPGETSTLTGSFKPEAAGEYNICAWSD